MIRLSLVEYGSPVDVSQLNNSTTGLDDEELSKLMLNAGLRISKTLRMSTSPIQISHGSVRAVDIAGILRISPRIEVEIAPKFLGLDSVNTRWREDFFFLATLSKHGQLLNKERLKATSGEVGDLHTLVARTMIDMFWSNHRRPLRMYNNRSFVDFAIDGDVEPESIVQPSPEGFEQSRIFYDRNNSYNSVILAAAKRIIPTLRDPSIVSQLERMIQALSPQQKPKSAVRNRKLPNRSVRWQPLFDLSTDILNGFGVIFSNGNLWAPGYVIDTWRIWQDFLKVSMRYGFGSNRVHSQAQKLLGTRQKFLNGNLNKTVEAKVTPDLIINAPNSDTPFFLLDAKYKGKIEDGQIRISEQDLYEALAFSIGTNCKNVLLAYPAIPSNNRELGQATIIEKIKVGEINVIAVEIELGGISSTGGLSRFSKKCSGDIEDIVDKWGV